MSSVRYTLLIALLVFPSLALAWGPDGHRIVADIADKHLTDKSRQAIGELLDNQSLEDVADWADEVRKEKPEWSPWHFVDIPFDAKAYDAQRDGKKGNNVIDKITHYAEVLSDRHETRAKRAESLKLLVHFVGDVHQPMHCITRDDSGGNARLVFFLDQARAVNLHSVWDSTILRHTLNGASDKVFAAAIDARISSADAKRLSTGTPEAWANESHEVAVKDAYDGVPADGAPPKLGENYVKRAEDDVRSQLAKAGLRLAALLNKIFE